MKVLIICDKNNSAIDRLAQVIKKYTPHLDIKILPFHPKRPSADQVADVVEAWDSADIVHVSYWKSGEKFKEMFPEKWGEKRKILWHHNPYDIDKKDWQEDYKKIVVHNSTIHSMIPYARLIPQCIDIHYWKFNDNFTDSTTVSMVIGRIEGKKGAREVAQACKELGYKFVLVGRISKRDYFNQIMEINPDTEFRENISDEELRETYYESAVHVCNSVDNFESGTMPILEAMSCGTPVLTRNIGHVPDLYNGDNMVVRNGDTSDVEDLKAELKEMMENRDYLEKIRQKAWETVKNRQPEKMARMFSTLYYQVCGGKDHLVSIIVPTFDRPKVLIQCLAQLVAQDYPNIEIIVADSGNKSSEKVVKTFKEKTDIPFKYIRFENHDEYTLAKARNLGIIEAEGDFIMFCDERMGVALNAVSNFINSYDAEGIWLYGMKDDVTKGFVENFSFVRKSILVRYGMFNERIDCYGGMSQDVRTRYSRNGITFQLIPEVQAKSLAKSSNRFGRKPEKVRAKLLLWKLYGTIRW